MAEVAGDLGFVGDVGSVTMELLSGPIMDLFGRKSISVGGLAVAGVAMFCKPLLGGSLTGLYILKVLTNMGTVPLMFGPYSTDYVAKENMGLRTTGYFLVVSQSSTMLSGAGAIQA